MRQREELSITVAPAAAKRGAHSPEVAPPAENSARSKPWIDSSSSPRTTSPPVELAPDRALGGERHDLRGRELPLTEQPQHQRAHLSGRSDHRDSISVAHRSSGYRSSADCPRIERATVSET